jgi:hypothetical protein
MAKQYRLSARLECLIPALKSDGDQSIGAGIAFGVATI